MLDRPVAHPQRSGQGFVLPLLAAQLIYQLLHQRRLLRMSLIGLIIRWPMAAKP
ncbi:MAG: hypothetical protein K9K30_15340 [Burkholderiaceae bacterium]|nr:hypothetical protein [Sulfuritalea sp.]MCF8176611.1 hypothetical protein [Burkholderiaceae bacterium]